MQPGLQPVILLIAHGSAVPDVNKTWRRKLLTRMASLLRDMKVELAFLRDPEEAASMLNRHDGKRLFILPLLPSESPSSLQAIRTLITPPQVKQADILPAIGSHPSITTLFRQTVLDNLHGHSPSEMGLLVIGHGTPTAAVQPPFLPLQTYCPGFASYGYAYLKQPPFLTSATLSGITRDTLAVPFFMLPGQHTWADIPRSLGIPEGEQAFGKHQLPSGRTLIYAPPLGTHPAFPEALAKIITEHLASSQ